MQHAFPPLIILIVTVVYFCWELAQKMKLKVGQRWKNLRADHPILNEGGIWRVQIVAIDGDYIEFIRDDGRVGTLYRENFTTIYNTRCE